MPKDFDPGREYTQREALDVTAALEAEQHRWLASARAALCFAYQHDFADYRLTAKVVPTTRLCTHGRCDGVLDLVDRAMDEWRWNYPNRTGSGYLRTQLYGGEPLPQWEELAEADNAEVAARAAAAPPPDSSAHVSTFGRAVALCFCGVWVTEKRWHQWMTGHAFRLMSDEEQQWEAVGDHVFRTVVPAAPPASSYEAERG